ncbi:MAG TPA: DUF4349 domain-containing protein [Mycobacteriales bacterium]|jgi:hypothetical protein
MIDELVLERALRAEAETYAVPEDGPAAVRAAASGRATRRRATGGRGRWLLAGAAAAAAAVVGLASTGSLAPAASRLRSGYATSADGYAGGGKDALLDSDSASGGVNEQAGAPVAPAARVQRTGDVTVEVRDVPGTLDALARVANGRGGFVAASTSGGDPESPTGSVTLRVPAAAFDATVADVRRLGDVVALATTGTDVTAQVEDVAARLRSLTAARAQLQQLLSRANTVGEVLSVQERLTTVQTEIEQYQARQKSLEDSTTYGTLRVAVQEPGTSPDREPTGFAKAWHDAVDGFVSAAQRVVAASGTIAFVLLAGLALALLLRPLYRAWVRRIV